MVGGGGGGVGYETKRIKSHKNSYTRAKKIQIRGTTKCKQKTCLFEDIYKQRKSGVGLITDGFLVDSFEKKKCRVERREHNQILG